MNKQKVLILLLLSVVIALFFILDLGQYTSLDFFQTQKAEIIEYYQSNPVQSGIIFFLIYVAITGMSLPGATIMTLIAGAIFGLVWGTVIVSFASTIGATIAFLIARFLFKDIIQKRYSERLKIINAGVEKDGGFYLFTLRLVPIFPFFIINVLMGLTPVRTVTFFFVSQIGMLPGTIVYINAGTQLAQISSTRDILSPELIFAFTLLGIFPLLARKILDFVKSRRIYKNYNKPEKFDRNLVVIGAGSAGLVSAYIAAAVRSKVTLIEKNRMGGDCLNTGCVPSKALIRSAKFLSHARRASEFGFKSAVVDYDFADVMQRIQRVIKTIAPHDSVQRYTDLGVECIRGKAKIKTPWSVEVNDQLLTTRNIIIAAGAAPFVPPIDGLEQIEYYTSDSIWNMRTLPERMVVLGGGPIGSELTQCFARFGSHVTQVEMLPRILVREDPEISAMITDKFRSEGIDVLTAHKAKKVIRENDRKILVCECDAGEIRIEFDEILVAVGRKPDTTGYGLEDLNIPLTKQGTVDVNDYMQTIYPNIYACGDVAGPYQFTHTAAHQAWYAAVWVN